jgi:hypothetical protein
MRSDLSRFFPEKSSSASDIPCSKTNLAVSSTEFCQAIFDEGNIGLRVSCCSGHMAMIPPVLQSLS